MEKSLYICISSLFYNKRSIGNIKIDSQKQNKMANKAKKSGIQALETTNAIHSESMKAKYEHGHAFQKQVYDWFQNAGFIPNFFPVNDGLGFRKADYQYDGVWVEAKTYIGDSDVTKILRLKPYLNELNIQMVVMCEFTSDSKEGKAHKKNVKHLTNHQISVFQGAEDCIGYIISEKIRNGFTTEIKMAKGINIPLRLLIPNPENRDLVIANHQIINKSIRENGFFTQLNVVPHELNEAGEMTYMLFEGHNRLSQLLELERNGFTIPPISCSLVDWVNSKDIEVLHQLLIKSNTTSKNWKLRDYVKSNLKHFETLKLVDRVRVFKLILDWMNEAKKQGWGETTPCYIFVHNIDMQFSNTDAIKNGTFDITEADYNETEFLLLSMINDLCKKLEVSINGILVRQILVEAKVKKNNDPEFSKVFKKYLEFVSDYISALITSDISLPGDKEGIKIFIGKMNNSFKLKKF